MITSRKMAVCSRSALALAIVIFPVIAIAYRPFHIPKNLFTSGMKDAHLPEGTRQISWQDSEDLQNLDLKQSSSSDLWSDEGKQFSRSRTRRAAASPSADPEIIEVFCEVVRKGKVLCEICPTSLIFKR